MNYKITLTRGFIFILILFSCIGNIFSDQIILKDHSIIHCKIINSKNEDIEYDPENEIPYNIINKQQVSKIIYDNGEIDDLDPSMLLSELLSKDELTKISNKRTLSRNNKFFWALENPIAFPLPPLPLISIEYLRILSQNHAIGLKVGLTSGMFLAFTTPPPTVAYVFNVAPLYRLHFHKNFYLGTALNLRNILFINFYGFTYYTDKGYKENAVYSTDVWQLIPSLYVGLTNGNIAFEVGGGIPIYKKMQTTVGADIPKKNYPADIDEQLLNERHYWLNVMEYYNIHISVKFLFK